VVASRPRQVALTGGIATGKTWCLRRFAALGAATVDADALAREAVAPGSAGLAAIAARFGAPVLGASGALDRAALGRLIFADPAARRDLEAIVHPAVYARLDGWYREVSRRPAPPPVAIAEIPLLYETGREGDFESVVVVGCPAEVQLARLRERDGLSEADARRRIAAQWPIEKKMRRADYVIDTSGTMEDSDAGVGRVWAALTGPDGPDRSNPPD
jgi:dephospho-CoA kinase